MTRDEAIEALSRIHYPDNFRVGALGVFRADNKRHVEKMVDGYVALGILKLDEPKFVNPRNPAYDKATNAIHAAPKDVNLGSVVPYYLYETLDKAGLKIVEK